MDVPYRGYTIIPNSERQPDGRWLPVAELELSERGVVTSKPPLRATALETRATRGDADVAAVKMAKAWIDATEREGSVTRPILSTTMDEEHDAPVARGVVVPRPAAPTRSAPAPRTEPRMPEGPDWAGLCRAVGLDSDEKVERLSRLLVIQFLLDRLLTLILGGKLASSSEASEGRDIAAIVENIAVLPIPARVELASRLGVIPPGVAERIIDVDRVGNHLRYSTLPRDKPRWEVGAPPEIASREASDRCLREGIEAAQDLVIALRGRGTEALNSPMPGPSGGNPC